MEPPPTSATAAISGIAEMCYIAERHQASAVSEPSSRRRVYTDGVFDHLHPVHVETLGRAKLHGGAGALLYVGVLREGATPLAERAALVRALRLVDGVVEDPLLSDAFLRLSRIDVVVPGEGCRPDGYYEAAKRMGLLPQVASQPPERPVDPLGGGTPAEAAGAPAEAAAPPSESSAGI